MFPHYVCFFDIGHDCRSDSRLRDFSCRQISQVRARALRAAVGVYCLALADLIGLGVPLAAACVLFLFFRQRTLVFSHDDFEVAAARVYERAFAVWDHGGHDSVQSVSGVEGHLDAVAGFHNAITPAKRV